MKPLSALALACWLTAAAPPASALPELVVLVRHAEKAAEPGPDPGLSDAGRARAQALVPAVAGLRITALITTQYRRARDTAAPLAQALGLQPQVVPTRPGDLAGHVQVLADAVRSQQGVVLVVGHSNTVTPLLAALGGPQLAELCETSFQHVFVVQPAGAAATAPGRWAQFSYGAPGAAPGPSCL